MGNRSLFSAVLVLFVLLLLPLAGHARQIAPQDGLEALRKAFSGINDFTADISQEKKLSVMKRTMKMNGVVRFRKPDLFYLEIVSPYKSRMLLNDAVIEQVMGGSNERSRIILPPEQGLKGWFVRFNQPVKSIPDGMNIQSDLTGSVYTVNVLPKSKGQIKQLSIVFQQDGTIKKIAITEKNGDRSTMLFKNIKRNTGLTARDFRL